MEDLKKLAVKSTKEYITNEERELLRNAGYFFNIKRGPGLDYAEIIQHRKVVCKVINGKETWL